MYAMVLVMAGGALGAGGRHLLGQFMLARLGPGFPWWTLSANVLGGLLMGLLVGLLARIGAGGIGGGVGSVSDASTAARLFFGVGLLGGFTTFSAFSMEFWLLFERGHYSQLMAYSLASVIGAILACGVGLYIMRHIPGCAA